MVVIATKRRRNAGPSPVVRAAAERWIIRRGCGLGYEPNGVGQATAQGAAIHGAWDADYSATLQTLNAMVSEIGLAELANRLSGVLRARAQYYSGIDGVLSRKWGRAAAKATELAFLGTLVGGKR